MTRLFFLLSGEHPTLPFAELKAILEAEDFKHRIVGKLSQVMRIETNIESIKPIVHRAALTRICSVELVYCKAELNEIFKAVASAPIEAFLKKDETFVVRLRRIGESAPQIIGSVLEGKLGALILSKAKGARVNLTWPNKTFFGILTDSKFIFGLKLSEIAPKPFMERRPRKRPFFHPSAMASKLARCMVNLAQPKAGELVLDPFCGTGAMLIEAGMIGCRVMGCDVQRRMIRGSLKNLVRYGIQPDGMSIADAKNLPTKEVDSIVTDPPYGRSATTLGRETRQVVTDFLSNVDDRLKPGRRICMASPRSIRVGKLGEQMGFKRVESHFMYVHRSLTREVTVLERV